MLKYYCLLFLSGFAVVLSKDLLFRSHQDIICPDKKGSCPPTSTCCQRVTGEYGCCPLPEATCCSDHEHCCPNSFTCDVEHQRCIQPGQESISWFKKTKANPLPSLKGSRDLKAAYVVCPDQQSQCVDNQTCCQLSSGQYSCCPMPSAVCCQDKLHCCPHSYKCDVAHQSCIKDMATSDEGREHLPWLRHEQVAPRRVTKHSAVNDIKCDATTSCDDSESCCKLESGGFGCCPLPEAVCCSDLVHCCPHGYKCNVQAGTCDQGSESITWMSKLPAKQTAPKDKTSNIADGRKECSGGAWCKDGKTCCESSAGVHGCCPFGSAVCCSDGLHCCPTGSTCDSSTQSCKSDDSTLMFTWLQTSSVDGYGPLRLLKEASLVRCPDGSDCPAGTTCCQLKNQQYACCPYEQAVCCSDQLHCCPHGMTCNVEHQRCDQEETLSLPWNMFVRQRPKKPSAPDHGQVLTQSGMVLVSETCPDLKSVCPMNTTCCQMQSGAYGCCPHFNAICCSDKLHCCPSGTTCDVARQSCVSSNDVSLDTDTAHGDIKSDMPFPFFDPRRQFP